MTFAANIGPDFVAISNRTRATFRRAELGFFGVLVVTLIQTPRLNGECFS